MTVTRLITVTAAVKSRSTILPLDTSGETVIFGTKIPATRPRPTNSSWTRPARSRRRRRVNRVPGPVAVRRAPSIALGRRPLLAGHGESHLAIGVDDEVPGQVDGDGGQGAREG